MAKKQPAGSAKTRRPRNVHVTKSGKTIKVHTSLSDRIKAARDEKALRKAERLKGMPKSRVKRFFYRLHPKRLAAYWFSREGGIMALKVTGISVFVLFFLMIGVFAYFRKDLPNLRDISGNNIGGSIRYYDRTGQTLLWEDYDAVKRVPVPSDQIAEHLKHATIALEDRDFYKHGGFDVRGITRAAWANMTGGSTSQGGSTITQQLVKLSLDWSADRSYTRKVRELIIAVEMERSYTKDEILTGYLNAAPYGNIQYGAQAAAQDYFRKDAKDLTLAESVFLAAIPQAPSYYSPYGAYFNEENSQGTTGRQALTYRMHYTLDIMHEMGFIDKEERDATKEIDVIATVQRPDSKYDGIKAPYFVLAAKEELDADYGAETVNRSGWKVITTLDLEKQQIAEEEVANGMAQVIRQGGNVAAFAAEDVETGQIIALVGGPDFNNETYGKNNYARMPLPPGSSIKPYDYAALIENTNNVGAGTVLYDNKAPLPGYPCTNHALPQHGGNCLHDFDRRFPGPVTIRYALGASRNVPAVKAMLIAGVDKTIETAENIMNASNPKGYGYNCYAPETVEFIPANEDQCYASAAIGDGAYLKMDEHVHGLATLSRNGLSLKRTYILKIEDSNNKPINEWKLEGGIQTVRPDTAYIMNDMLSDPRASYFGQKIQRFRGNKGEWKFAVKTGTTNDAKDGWMTGYSTKYAAAVWVGYHNRTRPMSGAMEVMTRPIFNNWMTRVHRELEPQDWQRPGGVQTLPAYVIRHHVGNGTIEPSPENDLYPSWYQRRSGNRERQVIDIVSGKLATECTPELAKREETTGSATQHSGDTFVDAASGDSNISERDDVHLCTDARPSATVAVLGSGPTYTLRATVTQGTHPLNSEDRAGVVNFKVNGQTVSGGSVTIAEAQAGISYTPTQSGTATVTAEVIDSVLYSSTSNPVTTNFVASGGFSLSFTTSAAHIDFDWSGASGNVRVYREDNNTQVCSGGSCNNVPKATLPSGTRVYGKDNSDAVSNVITVSY